jgi:hypothetical protein
MAFTLYISATEVTMFVKYDCGCVGYDSGTIWIVKDCRSEDDRICFDKVEHQGRIDDYLDKEKRPLNSQELSDLFAEIDLLMCFGHSAKIIRAELVHLERLSQRK